ncbi:proline-rich protein 19 [Ornithorhynchus anatinus]|uniref:proline-rich protein 19 n=1 Tax=Ornithorhynchus anatinus TaxID=9258 RepID=UPI0010A7CCED|nr:proline-rich protein 19 [Ornithorhynchus anatinus]
MKPQAPGPPCQRQPEATDRIRRRRSKRERDRRRFGGCAGGVGRVTFPGSQRPAPPLAGPSLERPAAPLGVVITRQRLSRDHRGLFNREVKSVSVERLLGSGEGGGRTCQGAGAAPDEGPPLPGPTPPLPGWRQLQGRRTKADVAPGGSGPGPSSPLRPPHVGELLGELRGQLPLPEAFPGRDLVQEARGVIMGALLAQHGRLPDLAQVLRGSQEQAAGPERESHGEWRQPGWESPAPPPPRETRRAEELPLLLGPSPGPLLTERMDGSLELPPSPQPPSPFFSSAQPERCGPWWGEAAAPAPTAFDMLKSIWLQPSPPPPPDPPPRDPPPLEPPWQWGPRAPIPLSCFPPSAALDWSPGPLAPRLLGRTSPEPWTFPRMKLY